MSTLTRPERWAALEAVWVDAVAASSVHPLGSVSWQSLGSCGARAELLWTAEPEQVGPWDAESMRSLCKACPVRRRGPNRNRSHVPGERTSHTVNATNTATTPASRSSPTGWPPGPTFWASRSRPSMHGAVPGQVLPGGE